MKKRQLLGCVLAVALAALGSLASGSFGDDPLELHPFTKEAPPGVGNNEPPNVFILVDTSASMLWATSGDVNDVPAPAGQYSGPPGSVPAPYPLVEPTPHHAVGGDRYYYYESSETWCTYGDGSQPYSGQAYWGRDLDPSNNIWNDENCYAQDNDDLRYQSENTARLVPNDSRAFKMKLVLWRLLHNSEIIRDARVGFATYKQSEVSLSDADWYRGKGDPLYRGTKWPNGVFGNQTGSNYYGHSVRITRGVLINQNEQSKRAMFREEPQDLYKKTGENAYSPIATNLSKVLRWFDGVETGSSNRELRFDGKRPLAQAIAFSEGRNFSNREGSLRDLFCARVNETFDTTDQHKSTKPLYIQQWCQGNYAIILTAGGQNRDNLDPVAAVKALHDTRLTYTEWGNDPEGKPYRSQPVKVFIVAFANPDPTSPKGIALKRTLERMADVGDDGEENGSAVPFYGNDVKSLLDSFKSIFRIIQNASGTGGAPLVSPQQDGSAEVFFNSFLPQDRRQWVGEVTCCTRGVTGNLLEKWRASRKLNARSYSARTAYVPDYVQSGNRGLLPVQFSGTPPVLAHGAELGEKLGLAPVTQGGKTVSVGEQATLFFRWLLGDKTVSQGDLGILWNEDYPEDYPGKNSRERYKLTDAYHGGMVEVGKGTLAFPDRPSTLYAQTNQGMLHAFKVSDGTERWAFIPPQTLEGKRLLGLKRDHNAWLRSESLPRYLLDGPISVEDATFSDGTVHTVLLGLTGRGGAGLYALDVSDPDSPTFLWAVENDLFAFQSSAADPPRLKAGQVLRWSRGSTGVTRTAYAHAGLPSSWNYRELLWTVAYPPVGWLQDDTGRRYAFLLSNGANPTNLQGPGNANGAVYLGNLQTGAVIGRYDEGKDAGKDKGPSVRPGNILASPLVLKEGDSRKLGTFLVGDDQGGVWKGICGVAPEERSFTRLLAPNVLPGSLGIAYSLAAGGQWGGVWLCGVTGDAEGLVSGSNPQGVFFSLRLSEAEAGSITSKSDLDEVLQGDQSASDSPKGFFLRFEHAAGSEELPTTPPVVKNGHVVFATFKPDKRPCKAGSARLYSLNLATGRGDWEGEQKYREVENVKISGLTVHGNKIYAGVTALLGNPDAQLKAAFGGSATLNPGSGNQNLLVLDIPPGFPKDPSSANVGRYHRLFWKKRF